MPSAVDEKAAEEDEVQDPSRPQLSPPPPPPPQAQAHSPLSQMTMHVYPFVHSLSPAQQQPLIRAKRRQVKNACTSCQKACKKCDDARPCLRCVKYGISDDCIDSQRKERRRGVKRGPYKKRDGKDRAGSHVDQDDMHEPVTASAASAVQPQHAEPSTIPGPCPPIGYPQGFYSHYPPIAPKPAESHVCVPGTQPYFLASVPQFQPHLHPIHGPESHGYPPQAYYTSIFPSVSYHHPQPQLIKPDHLSVQVPDAYPMFSVNVFPKQSVGGQNEMVHGPKNERIRFASQ